MTRRRGPVRVLAAVTVTNDESRPQGTFHMWLPEADPGRRAEGYDGTPVGPADMTAAAGAEFAAELAEVIRVTEGDTVRVTTGWTAPGYETVALTRNQAVSAVEAAWWAVKVLRRADP